MGTLTVLPVPAPVLVDRAAAAVAMTGAVLPGAATGLLVGAVLVGLASLGVPPAAAALLALGSGALATRFLHLDGLADTTDGLVASWDRDRALEVMRTGDVGPCGATVLVVVLGAQAAALAALADTTAPTALAAVTLAWAASRAVLPVLTARGTAAARPGGLGAGVLGSVSVPVAVLVPLAVAAVAWPAAGPRGPLAVGLAVLAAGLLARHAHRRLGGLTGDVLGAGVEVALLAALVVLSAG
ncbi:adenosylcobinamide-GDP ribazoletransferase [Aquipuribacter hungaricus]|uniref:Adenosylcobinamide-GDP ribazoletransferase n=1 Tax=Aquipuribacter hungaricus TaxID=545624 RepID=A0ABV7WE55_9MICO